MDYLRLSPSPLSSFDLDFLCIHPFRDGNGRVSRLLTLLALCQNGYEVGRYISLESLIEESGEVACRGRGPGARCRVIKNEVRNA